VCAGVVVAVSVVAGALAVGQRNVVVDAPVPDPASWFVAVQLVSACVWVGVLLFVAQRRDLWWWKLAFVAASSHALAALAYTWAVRGLVVGAAAPGAASAAALTNALLPVEVPVLVFMIVSLPSGSLSGRGLDRWGWAAVVSASAGVVLSAVGAPDVEGTDFDAARNPLSLGLGQSPVVPALIAGGALLGMVVLLVRWRRCTGSDRLAMRWVVWIQIVSTVVIVPVIAVASSELGVGVAQVASAVGLLAMVTVIRRQTLLGVERLLERTLRFIVLAACLAVLYALVIAVASGVVDDAARPIAAMLVALAVLPLRDGLGRWVVRFVYGDRVGSTEIIRRIAGAAGADHDPRGLVEGVLDELRRGTGASAVWVDLDQHGVISSPSGLPAPPAGIFEIELHHRGALIGRLRLAPPDDDVVVDAAAQRVTRQVAPHVAVLADAYGKQVELTQARTNLVRAREEERRRLRRDLHDGLGPILTGAAFSADAAANLVTPDPDSARSMIASTRHDIGTAIDEVRRIVENLRPPALDELGLAGAVRQLAQRFPQLDVAVTETGRHPDLPAAIEVAAYRIATEALTNVARHASATAASVEINLNGNLTLSVTDNGTTREPWLPGVGLTSMADRAAEAGGDLHAGPDPAGGGRVVVTFPAVAP